MQTHHPAMDARSEGRNIEGDDGNAQRQHPDPEYWQKPQQTAQHEENAYQGPNTRFEMVIRPAQQPKGDFGDALFGVHEPSNGASEIDPLIPLMSDHLRCFAGTRGRMLTSLQ